jgi:hypothetical protein
MAKIYNQEIYIPKKFIAAIERIVATGTFFEKKLLFSNSLLGYSWQTGVLSASKIFCF